MIAQFNRFEIELTKAQVTSVCTSGSNDAAVEILINVPKVRRQLNKIDPDAIRAELREYGAWDDDELADDDENRRRIIWLAAWNIYDDLAR